MVFEQFCCDEHLDNQGIVLLFSGEYKKQTNEEVADDNVDQYTPKFPYIHSEAMDKKMSF